MPNLIIDAVPQSETGEATGFNTLVRSVGASLGSQVAAAILAGSIVAGALPPATATDGVPVCAAVAPVAALMALAIPRVGEPGARSRPRGPDGLRGAMTRTHAPARTPSATTSA